MQVEWVDVSNELPNPHMYQLSDQVVIKTGMGYFGTGYYSHRQQRWETDGVLMGKDWVQFWLKGLE